jgi:hypothetical protein
MPTNYCINLNLDINPFCQNIFVEDLQRNPTGSKFEFALHTKVSLDLLNPELMLLLDELDLYSQWTEIFYTNPDQITGIHADSIHNDLVKMNFVFGGKKSQMCWYESTSDPSFNITVLGLKYRTFKSDEVVLLHEQSVNFPSLVQSGIPHNIKNYTEPRFCLSITLANKHKGSFNPEYFLKMDQAVHLFNKFY